MIDILSRFVRAIAFATLALLGMVMALVFMFSTAVAIGVLYVVARLRGKPFGVRAYWAQRSSQANAFAPRRAPGARPGTRTSPRAGEVIDVEAREVH